jgi:hypothetical protein
MVSLLTEISKRVHCSLATDLARLWAANQKIPKVLVDVDGAGIPREPVYSSTGSAHTCSPCNKSPSRIAKTCHLLQLLQLLSSLSPLLSLLIPASPHLPPLPDLSLQLPDPTVHLPQHPHFLRIPVLLRQGHHLRVQCMVLRILDLEPAGLELEICLRQQICRSFGSCRGRSGGG